MIVSMVACSYSEPTFLPIMTMTSSIPATPEIELEPSVFPQSSDSCEIDKWQVVPTRIAYLPIEDENTNGFTSSDSGWNEVFVSIAVKNESNEWGYVKVGAGSLSITTEGNFTYNAYGVTGGMVGPFTSTDQLPFPTTWTSQDNWGNYWITPETELDTEYIPPQFNIQGYQDSLTGQGIPYYFAFKVAATQKKLILHISGPEVDCLIQGDKVTEFLPDEIFDLSNISQQISFPTTVINSSLPNLGDSPIEVPNIGIITVTNIQRDSGTVTIKFTVTNSSAGEDTSGTVSGYIIGENGIIFDVFGGDFKVGPGQTGSGALIAKIPDSVSNLKFILANKIFGNSGLGIYQAFNLND